ncbi:MAG: glycoside hydrolase [Bacteroidota bacterium]|nr:glycoside hydrolase [Bacteroidota bacterium]
MKKIFITTALLCCFVVCFAIIADFTGKWKGSITTPDGNEFPLTYVLKVDGDKLTGTAQSPQGEVPINDGKISGADFSFSLSVNGTDIKHTGKYYAAADTAGLDIDFNGMKFHTTLKRDK